MKRQLPGGGLRVQQGRRAYYPFSPSALTPEDRAEGLESLSHLTEDAIARRIAYRAQERRAMAGVCPGCGGKMPNRHQVGCAAPNSL